MQINFLFGSFFGLFGEKNSLDVGQNSTLGNGHSSQKLVQLFIIADGQLQVTGNNTSLLVITSRIACQFQDLSGQILHDSSQVHRGTSTNTFCIISFSQKTMNTTNGEL